MDGGWIKLYWKTKDSLAGSSAIVMGVWCHLLLSTARRKQIRDNGMVLQAGECLISGKELAKFANCSDRTCRRMLNTFEAEGMIRVLKRDRHGTHLSVCNWETYQGDTTTDVRQQQLNDDETTIKRRRNSAPTEIPKSPKKPKSPKNGAAARFAPPTVDEVTDYCQERSNNIDAQHWHDYYAARGWELSKGRKMKDWKAAVRTWEKNSFTGKPSPATEVVPI